MFLQARPNLAGTYRAVRVVMSSGNMDVYGYRKARLLRLIALEFEGVKGRFANAIGVKPEQVYRWFPRSPTADTRQIEYKTARKIEAKLGLTPLCLESESVDAPFRSRESDHGAREKAEEILLPAYSSGITNQKDSPQAAEMSPWWPFPLVDRARYLQLSEAQKRLVQEHMNAAITLCEGTDTPRQKRPA